MTADRLPYAGRLVAPKSCANSEKSSLPLMVQPVIVVVTPASSVRVTRINSPSCAGLGEMLTETYEPAAPGATEMVAEPVDELKLESPEYVAVMLALPTGKTFPVTVKIARATPPAFTIG